MKSNPEHAVNVSPISTESRERGNLIYDILTDDDPATRVTGNNALVTKIQTETRSDPRFGGNIFSSIGELRDYQNNLRNPEDVRSAARELTRSYIAGTIEAVCEGLHTRPDLFELYVTGNMHTLRERLPECIKGLEAGMVNFGLANEDSQLYKILTNLDKAREEKSPDLFAQRIEEARVQIDREVADDPHIDQTTKDKANGVVYFLNLERQKIVGGVNRENELPVELDRQLAYVRRMLERIESTQRTTRDMTLGPIAARLEELISSSEMKPEVAVEIRARLKLHDCAVLMKKANGFIEQPKAGGDPECPTVGMASALAEGLNHALDAEAIDFFLKNNKKGINANGIPVAAAWDWYQDVNIGYRGTLDRITPGLSNGLKTAIDNDISLGTIDATYFSDNSFDRKKVVDEYVVNNIMRGHGVGKLAAEKAWDVARRLALATGENSVFNAAQSGNDEMAEDMYLKIYRSRRDEKGRPRGPQIHVKKIAGIGNSWLRETSKKPPYSQNTDITRTDFGEALQPLYARDVKARFEVNPKVNRDGSPELDTEGKQKYSEIGISEGSYVFHFGVWWSAKIHPMRGLLLDRQPDPSKLVNLDTLQTAQDYFAKADPTGDKDLKFWWVMGVLDMACSNGELGWTQEDISKFRQFLSTKQLSEKAGTFLSTTDWQNILAKGGFVQKMLKLDAKRIGTSFFGTMFGGSSTGGKRK